MEIFSERNGIDYNKIFNVLLQNLSPTFEKNALPEIFSGKLETFLTCFAVSSHMKNNILDETAGKFFEETSLNAIYKSLSLGCSAADIRLILSELPKILILNYPVVENIRVGCIIRIQELQNFYRDNVPVPDAFLWRTFHNLDSLMQILQTFEKNKNSF